MAAADQLAKIDALAGKLEAKVFADTAAERVAIIQAQVDHQISNEESTAELERLGKARDIQLCYNYGNLVPWMFSQSFGKEVPAALSREFKERLAYRDYVALLKADPLQGLWADQAEPNPRKNLSVPFPSIDDDR